MEREIRAPAVPGRVRVQAGEVRGALRGRRRGAPRRPGDLRGHRRRPRAAHKAERGRWPAIVPWPCSQPGFTEPAPLDAAGALLPHLCTLACAGEPAIGGVFLWHSPHGHPHWALPSKPGHRGARTFLNRIVNDSIATTSPAFSPHHASLA